jgi:DNA-binding response OmpR family regulator
MADRTRETILVVDDERGPRESLRMILSPSFTVLTAPNAIDALAILRREPIDIMTIDLNMPGMGGQDLLRRVHEEFPNTEVVVITGCATVESAAESVRIGICDYLEKPFDVVKVGAAIQRAVSRRRARGGLRSFLESSARWSAATRTPRRSSTRSSAVRSCADSCRGCSPSAATRASRSREAEELRTVDFLEVLAETIETKGRYMRGHARRVAFYAGLLAERMGLFGKDQEQVRLAASCTTSARSACRASCCCARARSTRTSARSSSSIRDRRAAGAAAAAAVGPHARDPAPPRVVGRHRLSRRTRGHRHPVHRADRRDRRRVRRDELRSPVPARAAPRGRARRVAALRGRAVRSAPREGVRVDRRVGAETSTSPCSPSRPQPSRSRRPRSRAGTFARA